MIGLWMIRGLNGAIGAIKGIPYDFTAHWTLSAIPMFLLMSAVASQSGISIEDHNPVTLGTSHQLFRQPPHGVIVMAEDDAALLQPVARRQTVKNNRVLRIALLIRFERFNETL